MCMVSQCDFCAQFHFYHARALNVPMSINIYQFVRLDLSQAFLKAFLMPMKLVCLLGAVILMSHLNSYKLT